MALQVCDLQSAMSAGTGAVSRGLRVDGGAAANDLLMRLQAALSGVAVTRPGNLETTALGAARMAMVGAGAVATPTDLPPPHGGDTTFAPEPDLLDRDATMARWRAAVERSKGWTGV